MDYTDGTVSDYVGGGSYGMTLTNPVSLSATADAEYPGFIDGYSWSPPSGGLGQLLCFAIPQHVNRWPGSGCRGISVPPDVQDDNGTLSTSRPGAVMEPPIGIVWPRFTTATTARTGAMPRPRRIPSRERWLRRPTQGTANNDGNRSIEAGRCHQTITLMILATSRRRRVWRWCTATAADGAQGPSAQYTCLMTVTPGSARRMWPA